MRRFALFAFVVLILAGGAFASAVLGIGPFARSAAASVVYVAISRSSDETDAREIEAIDLAAGTRELFDAGGRVTALAVSPDRRSLFVALDAGRVAFLDATTGGRYAQVDLRGPTVTTLLPDPDGRTLFAITATNVQSAVVPIDLDARKAGEPIVLAAGASSAALRGDGIVVAIADQRSVQVVFVSRTLRTVTDSLTLPRASLAAPATVAISATLTAVVGFDPSGGGGGTIRVALIEDATHWQEVALAAPFGIASGRSGQASVFAATSTAGVLAVCVPAGAQGRRYVMTPDRRSAIAGTECGPLAGGTEVLLARRDPAQLLVLDPTTGRTTRTLPLAGVPGRLTR